jgi:hypothetical protein
MRHNPPMRHNPFLLFTLACCTVLGLSCTVPADAGVVVTIDGNVARAEIDLGGTPQNPQYSATMFLTFDSPVGLTPENLNINAHIVDPDDPALRARLPGGGQVSVPAQFPVLISVSPPADGDFAFVNAAQVEVITDNLAYTPGTPYRLFKSPPGGMFSDLTESVASGSIRSRSRTGGFSDFMLVEDLRSAHEVAEDKYAFLQSRVNDDDIDPETRALLDLDLEDSFEEFQEGEYGDAREELDDLELRVDAGAGDTVPNVWRAARDLDNVAGSLEGEAASLDFHLRRLAGSGGGGGDEDDDDDGGGGGDDDDDDGDDD